MTKSLDNITDGCTRTTWREETRTPATHVVSKNQGLGKSSRKVCRELGTNFGQFSSVQSFSRVWLFATPWTAACQASLSISNSRSLLKFMSIESVMSPSHLILCRPLLLPPSSFPASGSFQMSQFFASGGQSIGVSASASLLPMNIQDRFPLGWTDWISLLFKGLSRVFSNNTVQKHQFFSAQLSFRGDTKTRDKQAAKERPSQNFLGFYLLGICCLKWSQPSNLQYVNTGIVKHLSC